MQKAIDQLIVEYQEGEGEKRPDPILFVHGMWSGSWYWADFMEYFSKLGYDCWALNLRGHGPNPRIEATTKVSFTQYAEDVEKVIAGIGALPIVIGHSMGGLLAQKVAEVGLAKAVVLIASAPPWSILTIYYLPWLLRHLKQLPALLLKRPLLPSYGLAARMILNCLTEEDRRRIYTQMIPESGQVGLEILLGRVVVDERRVTCAVLAIAGGKDQIISVREAKKASQRYNANFKEYPNRGHWMTEEGWEGIAHDISEWLEKKAGLRHRLVP